MAPSSASARTPNFSRPLPSPFAAGGPTTPSRSSGRRDGGLLQSSTMANIPGEASTTMEPSPGRRLFGTKETTTPLNSLANKQLDSPAAKDASKTASPFKEVRQGRRSSKASEKSEPSPRSLTFLRNDQGALEKPIMNFRPQLWPYMDKERPILNLNLFWPIKREEINDDDEEEENSDGDSKGDFPFKELKPLITFRNLHYLQLTGMMRSYQPIIWEACWVNKNLTKLHLEMALEPEIKKEFALKYRKIDSQWSYNGSRPTYAEPTEYLGSHGTGILHEEFGYGEYLDQQAMKQAQKTIAKDLPVENMRYLPVTHITLMHFAVDAGPFFRWFDPKKLKEITFKGDCFDTGFYLPDDMRQAVKVSGPPKPMPRAGPMVARVVKPGEVKLVTLKGGKVVPDEPKEGAQGTGGGSGGGEAKGLKAKVSQMMRLGKKDAKEAKGVEKETAQLERNMANMGL